jgi:hypothetical protein
MKIFFSAMFFIAVALIPVSALAQSTSRSNELKQIQDKRAELNLLEKQFLAPSAEDGAAYADFLRQADTGLFRLLPRELFDSEVYRKNLKTITMRGGGAYYSFSRRIHEYGYGSDIELDSGSLSVGFAGADFGMISKVGDVPLEEISLDHRVVHFLLSYEPPVELSQARIEQRRFNTPGVAVEKELYVRRTPVEIDTTYLLRSINYSTSDVLVAFRPIRKDSDGSVTILWKLLKAFPKPELARNKAEQ